MKEVNGFERELLEHIDMRKLACKENDGELKSMGRCNFFLQVQAGAGGTESMDWAALVMQMYYVGSIPWIWNYCSE
uniref:Peptide chain release factor domain-containing protein n=1 Tax=Nelumbo nucifera TaxID=4432 RepID=A0A822YQM9_NELNU|nr:TPA_asm: hypothetical protein HUJ06_011987 [Nelumbo nucifera]